MLRALAAKGAAHFGFSSELRRATEAQPRLVAKACARLRPITPCECLRRGLRGAAELREPLKDSRGPVSAYSGVKLQQTQRLLHKLTRLCDEALHVASVMDPFFSWSGFWFGAGPCLGILTVRL